ncbi:MAG TPA: hypothetical protein PLL08_07225 [Bacteroidales bacterium]|nr:hypothetical protein [Bacteroidales bacterium]
MKKLTLICLMLSFAVITFAQKDFGGVIKLKTYAEGTTDPNILSQSQSEYEETVLGSLTKIVASQGGIGTIVIRDGNTGIMNVILDLSAMAYGKYLVSDTLNLKLIQFDYEYDETDTREIAGYKCKKAVVTIIDLETDDSEIRNLYVTDDLMNPKTYKSYDYPGLKGYPLYTAVEVDNAGEKYTIIVEASEITPSKKVKPIDFLLPAGWKPIQNAPESVKAMFGLGGEEDEE